MPPVILSSCGYRGAGADRSDPGLPDPVDDPGDPGETRQIPEEIGIVGRDGVPSGQGEFDAVLAEIVADRHLPAEAVTPVVDGHFVELVGEGLYQNRNVQARKTDGIGHSSLVTEVGKGDQDAVDLVCVLFEKRAAFTGIIQAFHTAEFGIVRAQSDDLDPCRSS